MISLTLRHISKKAAHSAIEEQADYRLFCANETVYYSKALVDDEGYFSTRVYNTTTKQTTSLDNRLITVASCGADCLVALDHGDDDLTHWLALINFETNTTHWIHELPDDVGFKIESMRLVLSESYLGYSFDYGDYDSAEPFPNDHRLMHFRSYTREGGVGAPVFTGPVWGTLADDSIMMYTDADSSWWCVSKQGNRKMCTTAKLAKIRSMQTTKDPLHVVAWSTHSCFFVMHLHLFRVDDDGHLSIVSKNVYSIEKCGSTMKVMTPKMTIFKDPATKRTVCCTKSGMGQAVEQTPGTFKSLCVRAVAGNKLMYVYKLLRRSPMSVSMDDITDHRPWDHRLPMDLAYSVAKYLIPMSKCIAVLPGPRVVFDTEVQCKDEMITSGVSLDECESEDESEA